MLMTPVLNVVALAPVKDNVTGKPVTVEPVTPPVKVTPKVFALLMVLLANTLMVRPVVKAVPVEILSVPPLRLIAPDVLPKLVSAPTDNVPALIVVPPV